MQRFSGSDAAIGDGAAAVDGATGAMGLVVCRAGENPFAFLPNHVATIETWHSGRGPHAREAFALAGGLGKLLVSADGDCLGVDSAEILADSTPLLPPPRIIAGGMGGSLFAFAKLKERVLPVLRLAEFVRFLSHKRPGESR